MPDPSVPPPLKVFQVGGSAFIPVFELELSGGTVTKQSPIRVRYMPTSTTGVAASRLINTTAPLAGGGDLSVDRTHTVDTAAVVTSGRSISTSFPIAGGGDLSANRTFSVDTAFLVTSTRAVSTVAPMLGGGNLSADRTINLTTGGAGTVFISSGTAGWATSSSVVRTTTVRMPMALSTVQPTTGNAYWVGRTSTTIDVSYVEYLTGAVGLATYWATVPNNLAPSPLWNLMFYHNPSVGSGGNVVLSVSAATIAAGGSTGNVALTNLMNAVALSTRAVNVLEVSTGTATNFDGTLAIAANDLLRCQVWRLGGNASDNLSASWDLYAVQLRCDVLT